MKMNFGEAMEMGKGEGNGEKGKGASTQGLPNAHFPSILNEKFAARTVESTI